MNNDRNVYAYSIFYEYVEETGMLFFTIDATYKEKTQANMLIFLIKKQLNKYSNLSSLVVVFTDNFDRDLIYLPELINQDMEFNIIPIWMTLAFKSNNWKNIKKFYDYAQQVLGLAKDIKITELTLKEPPNFIIKEILKDSSSNYLSNIKLLRFEGLNEKDEYEIDDEFKIDINLESLVRFFIIFKINFLIQLR